MSQKYLVLGGSGFLGASVVAGLVAGGHEVRVISPSATRLKWKEGVTAINGYIADAGLKEKQVGWCDSVLHFVSTTNPKSSQSDHYHNVSSNLLPLISLLEYLHQLFMCNRFAHKITLTSYKINLI